MAVSILPYLETCTYCLRSHIWGWSFSYVDPLYQKFISCSYCAQFKCQFYNICYALKIKKKCMYRFKRKYNIYMFFKIAYNPFWYHFSKHNIDGKIWRKMWYRKLILGWYYFSKSIVYEISRSKFNLKSQKIKNGLILFFWGWRLNFF